MEIDKDMNSNYYKYSENGIKSRNLKLWESINQFKIDNSLPSFKEAFYLKEKLMNEIPKCECGSDLTFLSMKSGFRNFCSQKCMMSSKSIKEKRKSTNLEKYGVDNPSKSKEVKEKVKSTNVEKFGSEYPLQSSIIMEKVKSTNMERYGVDNPSKSKLVREKAEETNLERYGSRHYAQTNEFRTNFQNHCLDKYGVDNPSKVREFQEKRESSFMERFGVSSPLKNESIKQKSKSTNLERYGFESYTQTQEYKDRIKEIVTNNHLQLIGDQFDLLDSNWHEFTLKCKNCNKEFTIVRQLWNMREKRGEEKCLICNPISNSISRSEKEVLNYIQSIYSDPISENHRIEKKEIDIFLSDLNIGFEFNGVYWHSELYKTKNYHSDKLNFFKKKNITIYQIWEDDWKFRNEIVKSMISTKIGKTINRIYARKCEIREVTNDDCRKFLTENHIQGFLGSKIKIGLFFNQELVSLMTFGSLRKSLGQKSKDDIFELLRFCNKLHTSVIGGASKLLKHFINKMNPKEIISYSNNCYSDGNLYQKLGFKFSHSTMYNYWWVNENSKVKYHRFNFRKNKLVKMGHDPNLTESEIMRQIGYYKIFDSGSSKWIFNI